MSEKKSQFIEVETLTDSQYVPVFGSGVDRKISKPNLFSQIKDESFSPFIYPTIAILQSADLEVDVDNPTYCRCEETEYRLYKITNAAPGVDDIALTNGNTAEYQIEYRDTGFVTSVATTATGALAVFTDSTGQEIDKSVVPTNAGKAFIQATDGASISFPRKNADNTVTMRSASQYFDDIKQSATHGAAGVIKTADGTSTLAQTATDEAITPANLATLKASNAETLTGTDDTKYITPENLQHKLESDGVLIIDNFAALASTPVSAAGQVVYVVNEDEHFYASAGAVTTIDGIQSNSDTSGFYFKTTKDLYSFAPHDFSGLIQTNGKKVVITGDSLSYNNYGFGFAYAATAQECNAGLRSWGFMLRDAIHMSDPCFVYGDNIPWHINNSTYAAVAINNTNAFVLPFNNRSLRIVVSNASAEVNLSIKSFSVVNKQIVLHLAHSPSQPGAFDIYYNDNNGGADVFVSNVVVGDGVDHQGYEPFTVTIPVNTLDTAARIIFKNFTDDDASPLSAPMAFYVLAAGSKLTNVYTTGVGGQTAEYFVTNYASKIGTYAPDLLVMCVGANDRMAYTLQRHLDALETIFENAVASNPYCKIILITTPPALLSGGNIGYYPDTATNTADSPAIEMKDWVAAVEQLCHKNNVAFFNQYRFLYDLDGSYLFVDGIHLTRNAGRDVFKALIDSYFPQTIAPVEQLHGYSTYSVAGTGDLMGRQIGLIEKTKATPDWYGQFKITYTHGTTSWAVSEHYQKATNKPCALKAITIPSSAHTTTLEFYAPVMSTAYNETATPINAEAFFVGGTSALITSTTVSPLGNNTLKLSIRDSTGALIDPATMDGCQILVKYSM